jgi:hypothetical protein
MRIILIRLHLWMASFLSAILLMIAISGGLYLFGLKGSTETTQIVTPAEAQLDANSESLEADVRALLSAVNYDYEFEYIKQGGNSLVTRPTSRTYYEIKIEPQVLVITRHDPDWIKAIVDLHKGHGPLLYKRFQQFTAAGLVFVLLTGLWLGLSSKRLRQQTILAVGLGLLVFLTLALQ